MKRVLGSMIIGLGMFCCLTVPALAQQKAALPDPTAFTTQLEAGNIAKAQEWLDAGMSPDFLGARIGSGLMIGAWEGNFDLMRLYLSRGADINAMNANGETALALAAWKGKMDVVKWLLERGARINSAPRQWSPLHYAVFAGNKEVANYLIAHGADIDARSTNGSSVLMMAIYEGHEDLVRTLVEKGADRTVKNDWGDGGLEWAMRYDRLKIARMVTSPEEFNIAVAAPKEKWGEGRRSAPGSAYLDKLMRIREALVARGQSTKVIDDRIAAEQAHLLKMDPGRKALPPRAATLEITASRKNPNEQSANIVYDEEGKPKGFKVPPATYSGQPKMPVKGQVKNY
ncbi:MAG: ankyrin repeat domain-containing protein [Betaproteobacteria bacterium]